MERADRAAVATFHVPGAWGPGDVVVLDDAAAHHVAVKRLRDGDPVRLTSGDGRRALGQLAQVTRRAASVRLEDEGVELVAPLPAVILLAPVGDRERMLMLAEKAAELGVTEWRPVVYRRSRSVTPRGEGAAFRARVRLRMIAALEQSGGAWLPRLHDELPPGEARAAVDAAGVGTHLLLDAAGAPLAHLLATARAPLAIALGPEGGLEPDERAGFVDAGWRPASLGPNILRFETAAIGALAVARAHLNNPAA